MTDNPTELPYAIMCELRAIAGDTPSTNFKPIGEHRPSPEAMNRRRPHMRPMSAWRDTTVPPKLESKYEYRASTQDLVDFGLLKHGFLHEGNRQTTHYGFHLTEKAVEILRAQKSSPATADAPPDRPAAPLCNPV